MTYKDEGQPCENDRLSELTETEKQQAEECLDVCLEHVRFPETQFGSISLIPRRLLSKDYNLSALSNSVINQHFDRQNDTPTATTSNTITK